MRILTVMICLAALAASTIAGAEAPPQFTHQGVLLDSHGDPVADGDYNVRFKLCDRDVGGTVLWAETKDITCKDGLFSTILGDIEALTLPFDRTYWLEVQLAGEDPMIPRVQLTPVPYAIRALNAEAVADDDWQISGDDVYHTPGQVSIGDIPQSNDAKLYVVSPTRGIYARLKEDDAAADQRAAVYGVRWRIVENDGSGYSLSETNNAVTGYNSYGDSYTFGVAGYTTHDSPYTGGVIGAPTEAGDNWGALGYRDANTQPWGLYTPGAAYVGSTLSTEAFHMLPGAVDGYVLTCTDAGFAYWEPPAGGFSLPYSGSTSHNGAAFDVTNTYVGSTSAISGTSSGYYGGYFTASRASSNTHVLHAEADVSGDYDARAVYGKSTPADNYGYGGYFEGGFKGVYGKVVSTEADAIAHYSGVEGLVEGVYGTTYGVRGRVSSGDGENYGVYGKASSGVTNYAGYFSGNVHVDGTLSKGAGSFKIDHPLDPENKYLSHSFVESPDMMNIYNGNVVLDPSGEAWVTLPDWFEALNRDFRYQLTPIGGPGPNLYVAEKVSGNRFKIAGGPDGLEVSWQVTGVRHDPFAEKHRIAVEEDKTGDERGMYLNPELYGQPEHLSLHRTPEEPQPDRD